MPEKKTMVISSTEQLLDSNTRRSFLKLMGAGGAVFFLPSVLTSCSDDDDPAGPSFGQPAGSGPAVVIDFSRGDVAIIQYAYALEQLEADFYTRVVAASSTSNLSAAERVILTDVKYHEVIHRDAFKAILGASNDFTLNTTYGNLNFADRTSVLATARTFEDLGVAAYNGAAQYLTVGANLELAGKIVSVEARHAAVIRDLIAPKSSSQGDAGTSFAPKSFDDAFSPGKVVPLAQPFVVERLTPRNPPATFVQGPNNNG
ncbi:MAG: ferritin-like domain-containing protein [Gemmatimonadota bacterium]|nr:ferritin-like domain-containing protein [Gemmatimonadota bacterium]